MARIGGADDYFLVPYVVENLPTLMAEQFGKVGGNDGVGVGVGFKVMNDAFNTGDGNFFIEGHNRRMIILKELPYDVAGGDLGGIGGESWGWVRPEDI